MRRRPLKGLPPKCLLLRFDANTREMIDDEQASYELSSENRRSYHFFTFVEVFL